MSKEYDMEAMAEMSIDQIDALANEAPGDTGAAKDGDTLQADESAGGEKEEGEQVVEGAATGAAEEGHGGVETKSGKGTIPYAVLKETREELAEMKRRLETLQSKPYQAVIPENHAELVAATTAGLAALNEKFELDEIGWEDYQKELGELTVQRENLLAVRIKAEISSEMQAEMAQKAEADAQSIWDNTVSTFLSGKPDGIDYNADPEKHAELDAAVKMYASNPANATKDHQWFLDKAHREVMENNGIKPAAKQPPPAKAKVEEAGDDPEKAPIYSLGDIPGGVVPGGSEVEQITQLSGSSLTNRFLNDPGQIDKVLASFG